MGKKKISTRSFCLDLFPAEALGLSAASLSQRRDGKHETSDSENRQPKQKIVTYEIILLITPEQSKQLGFIPEAAVVKEVSIQVVLSAR